MNFRWAVVWTSKCFGFPSVSARPAKYKANQAQIDSYRHELGIKMASLTLPGSVQCKGMKCPDSSNQRLKNWSLQKLISSNVEIKSSNVDVFKIYIFKSGAFKVKFSTFEVFKNQSFQNSKSSKIEIFKFCNSWKLKSSNVEILKIELIKN